MRLPTRANLPTGARVGLRTAGAITLGVLVLGLSAACTDVGDPSGSTGEGPRSVDKSGDGTEQHELDPLATRIPALGDAVDSTWFSGTLGSARAPGPSLYWIDAVVTLPPGVADELRSTLALTPAEATPDVVEALGLVLPVGALLVGDGLDEAFSHQTWQTTAYLSATGDEVVLEIIGG